MSVDRPPEASPRPWPYLSWRHGLLLAAHLHSRPSLRRFLMDNAYEPLPYDEIMGRIGELAEGLRAGATPDTRTQIEELLYLMDAYHRQGLGRLLEMIRSWRGEIFLDAVARDDIAGSFVSRYDLGESQ